MSTGNLKGKEFFKQEFLERFFTVDRSIREEKKGELLEYVNNQTNPAVNLSGDPVLHVVIAYGKSGLACDLIGEMQKPPGHLLAMRNKLSGDTALHAAASMGDETVTKKLLETDYHLLQHQNKLKETPLHKAAFYGQRRMFKLLEREDPPEKREASIFARTGDGNTILHCAILSNTPDLALYIAMHYPGLMESRNMDGMTPFHLLPEMLRTNEQLRPQLDPINYTCQSM